MMKKRRAVCE